MTHLLLHNARLMSVDAGWLLIEDGHIGQIGQGTAPDFDGVPRIDAGGATALPGFIDPHVHGAMGYDTMDATPKALQTMACFFASRGVTSFLPTTMTASDDGIRRALENVARCMGPVENGATVLGAHMEGPYINSKMKGAQGGEHIRPADPAQYRRWLDLGVIRQVTVAPEFPANRDFIRDCTAHGINVSLGHTQATYEDVQEAVALGARQTTHTFNAMTGVHHRNPGTVGAALSVDPLMCELIADNIHVHPAILKLVVRAKGTRHVVLVTDAIRGVGMDDGQYELGGQTITVGGGRATLSDGTLAGSILTMDCALSNIMAATGLPLSEAWPMSSANAAAQIGLGNRKGRLAEGYDADIVLLDAAYRIELTMAEGRVVYRA